MKGLQSSTAYQNLGIKIKFMGMEACDLLAVLIFSSVMDLLFGHTSLRLWLVLILPLTMAIVLFFAKRNKPEHFLIHLIRYYCNPQKYSAGVRTKDEKQRIERIA